MYEIKDNNITVTRGDTFEALLTIYAMDDTVYHPVEGDTIKFALKRTPYDRKPIIEKDIPTDSLLLALSADETKKLPFNEYMYDIRLLKANGIINTFITQGKFKVALEVHTHE